MKYTELIERLRNAARHDSVFGDDVREHASEQAADVIESLQAEVERLKTAAKYAEHIDATPENQRETMLHDALTERNALRTQIKSARRDALEEAALVCDATDIVTYTFAGQLYDSGAETLGEAIDAIRKLKDET